MTFSSCDAAGLLTIQQQPAAAGECTKHVLTATSHVACITYVDPCMSSALRLLQDHKPCTVPIASPHKAAEETGGSDTACSCSVQNKNALGALRTNVMMITEGKTHSRQEHDKEL